MKLFVTLSLIKLFLDSSSLIIIIYNDVQFKLQLFY